MCLSLLLLGDSNCIVCDLLAFPLLLRQGSLGDSIVLDSRGGTSFAFQSREIFHGNLQLHLLRFPCRGAKVQSHIDLQRQPD